MKRKELRTPALLTMILLLSALFILALAGCTQPQDSGMAASEPEIQAGTASSEGVEVLPENDGSDKAETTLLDLSANPEQNQITAAGAYRLTGSLEGSVTVDADGPVTLILEGVTLVGQDCLDIRQSAAVTISAAPGTVNLLTDTVLTDEELASVLSAAEEPIPAEEPASEEAAPEEPASEEAAPEQAASEEPAREENTSEEPAREERASDESRADDASEEAAPETAEPEVIEEEAEEENDTSGQVISSDAPLVFTGEGRIDVYASINNGIRCDANVTVESGVLSVTAVKKAVKTEGAITVTGGSLIAEAGSAALAAEPTRLSQGMVSLQDGSVTLRGDGRGIDADDLAVIAGGTLNINTGNDGIRSDTVDIIDGTVYITSDSDGIQGVTLIAVEGGVLSVTSGGGGGDARSHPGDSFGGWGETAEEEETASQKGLKCEGAVTITGGEISLSTADDAIHCDTVCTVDGGRIDIISSDDGIHADDMLVIESGSVNLLDCFEGLEAFAVELRGGDTLIRSVNDGINANGSEMMSRSGDSSEEAEITSASGSATTYVRISGGTLDLAITTSDTSNMGDGIDSNGSVFIEGGTTVVSTYGTFLENGLDTGSGGPIVTGGAVMAAGSSSMGEDFGSSSTQCCATIATDTVPANTEVTLYDEDGSVIWSAVMMNPFTCLQISHPAMQPGHVYTLTFGDQTKTLDFTNTTNIEKSGGGGFGFR